MRAEKKYQNEPKVKLEDLEVGAAAYFASAGCVYAIIPHGSHIKNIQNEPKSEDGKFLQHR